MAFARAEGGIGREEMRVFGGDGGTGLAKRAEVVEDPERAAVRRNDERVIVNDHVVDRRDGEIELERLPVCAVVERNIDAGFGAGVEQAFALGIFADGVDVNIVG